MISETLLIYRLTLVGVGNNVNDLCVNVYFIENKK